MANEQDPNGQTKKTFTQEEINDGQKQINGALCFVDWQVIYALTTLVDALAEARLLPDLRLSYIKEVLARAEFTSKKVASIDPPGCDEDLLENGFPKEPEGLQSKEPEIKAA